MRTMGRIGVLLVTGLVGAGAAGADETKLPKASRSPARVHVYEGTRVNINTASRAELMKLEGVGASIAQKIIAYREKHGRFKRVHDLERVDGVDKAVFERNAGRIVVK